MGSHIIICLYTKVFKTNLFGTAHNLLLILQPDNYLEASQTAALSDTLISAQLNSQAHSTSNNKLSLAPVLVSSCTFQFTCLVIFLCILSVKCVKILKINWIPTHLFIFWDSGNSLFHKLSCLTFLSMVASTHAVKYLFPVTCTMCLTWEMEPTWSKATPTSPSTTTTGTMSSSPGTPTTSTWSRLIPRSPRRQPQEPKIWTWRVCRNREFKYIYIVDFITLGQQWPRVERSIFGTERLHQQDKACRGGGKDSALTHYQHPLRYPPPKILTPSVQHQH